MFAVCDIQSCDYAYAIIVLAACMCYTQCVACAIPHTCMMCLHHVHNTRFMPTT